MSETAPHSSDSLLSSAATASVDQASGSRDDSSSSSTMMMMMTLVQMNNDGVFYLEHGYFQEAIQTWSTALRLAMTGEEDESDMPVAGMPVAQKRQQQRRRGNPTPNSTTNKGNFEQPSRVSSSTSNRRRRRHRNNSSAPSVPPTIVTEDCQSSSHDHLRCPHVYTTPIRIVDRYDLPSIPRLILLCTFNLALANHMELMMMTTSSHDHDIAWRHVLKLYKVVHTLQIQFEDVQNNDVDDIIPAFDVPHSLGLINNVAVVYHILGRHTKADTCWHHLLSTVLCLIDQQQQQELVNCEDMDGYLENMWHLVVDEKTTVPIANAA